MVENGFFFLLCKQMICSKMTCITITESVLVMGILISTKTKDDPCKHDFFLYESEM